MIFRRVAFLIFVGMWSFGFHGLFIPGVVLASQQAQIRALFPQPSTGQAEWILVENTGLASASAVLQDTHGSVKLHSFVLVPTTQWYQISATASGIALNNDTDSVTLSIGGQVIDTSLLYTSSIRDQVWTRMQSSWEWLSLSEFEVRWQNNDWSKVDPVASSSATATGSAQITASATPVAFVKPSASGSVLVSPTPSASFVASTPYPGKVISLAGKMSELPTTEKLTPPYFQEPDYEAEMQKYSEWLAWWQKSLWLWVASGACWLTLGFPGIWKLIQKRRSRRLGWSLLS